MNISLPKFCARAEKAAKLLKSLSNPNRLMILCRLREGACSVGALEELVGLGQSALSQHLARLRHDGLVKTRREAQTIFYSLADPYAARLIGEIYALYCVSPPAPLTERKKK